MGSEGTLHLFLNSGREGKEYVISLLFSRGDTYR
jgi:hypothetical protein